MNDLFGGNVTIQGDIIVVSARLNDYEGTNTGSAYLFKRPACRWQDMSETLMVNASNPIPGAQFGLGVAFDAGGLFVGSHVVNQTRGSAYVFSVTCNLPPIISCNGPVVLWSPNHDLMDVSSSFTMVDPNVNDEVSLSFRVFSDEPELPETGDGTGRHAPDFKDEHDGGRGLLVRSERRGAEDGRFYILVVTADDGNGGVTTEVCIGAVVPHDSDPQSLDDVMAQATAAALDIESVLSGSGLPEPGDPLPSPIEHLFEHGLSRQLGPKQ